MVQWNEVQWRRGRGDQRNASRAIAAVRSRPEAAR